MSYYDNLYPVAEFTKRLEQAGFHKESDYEYGTMTFKNENCKDSPVHMLYINSSGFCAIDKSLRVVATEDLDDLMDRPWYVTIMDSLYEVKEEPIEYPETPEEEEELKEFERITRKKYPQNSEAMITCFRINKRRQKMASLPEDRS